MIETNDARDPRTEKMQEWSEARIEQQEADIAFVAMMADIDLEGDDDAEAGTD